MAANPSIDRLYELERLTPGAIHRPRLVLSVAGGKGLNAARAAASLGAGVEIGVGFVKINAAEAEEVSGHAVANVDQATVAGRVILQRARASRVIVTLGALGAVLVTREGALHASLPMASAGQYTVGSGDAFLGGLATGIMEGASADDAVRLASAAAVANTMVPGPGVLDASAARRLAQSVSLVEV